MRSKDPTAPLELSLVTSVEGDSWGTAWAGLARRIEEQAPLVPAGSPFVLNIVFHVPGRFVEPDWSGIRMGRLSKRYGVLDADVVLAETAPEDAVTEMLQLISEVVDAASAYARKRKIADDLPEIREALRRLKEAGPAPVRSGTPPEWAAAKPEGPGEGPLLRGSVSSGESEVDPSEGMLELWLNDLLEEVESYVLLERLEDDSSATLRLTKVAGSIHMERTETAAGPRYAARTEDEALVYEVAVAWAFQREPLPSGVAWQRVG